MKLSYYTTLDGADPLPKLGALVRTRVEEPSLGPVLAGKTAREGVFSDAKGRLFTRFEENACAPVDGAKPGMLNVHDSLYYGELTHKAMLDRYEQIAADFFSKGFSTIQEGDKPDLSDDAIDALCATISAGPSRAEIKADPIGPKKSMREWEKAYYERAAAQQRPAWFEQQYQQRAHPEVRQLAVGETCTREEIEDGLVRCPREHSFDINLLTGLTRRVA